MSRSVRRGCRSPSSSCCQWCPKGLTSPNAMSTPPDVGRRGPGTDVLRTLCGPPQARRLGVGWAMWSGPRSHCEDQGSLGWRGGNDLLTVRCSLSNKCTAPRAKDFRHLPSYGPDGTTCVVLSSMPGGTMSQSSGDHRKLKLIDAIAQSVGF